MSIHHHETGSATQPVVERSSERQIYVLETQTSHDVYGTCRNCGQRTRNALEELCGRRNCDTVAALPITIDDQQWTQILYEKYVQDPRTQIVMDSPDPNAEPKTKAPNLMSVMWAIAEGRIAEVPADEQQRAIRFCAEMRGV